MRKCNDWIETYLEYTKEQESCSAYHTWVAISLIAGSLGRKVFVDRGSYKLYPNQYIILVGESGGARKSSAIRVGSKFLGPIKEKSSFIKGKLSLEAMIKEMQSVIVYEEGNKEYKVQGTSYIQSSELASLLGQSVYQKGIVTFLTDAYDSEDEFHWITIKEGRKELKNLCVNLLAASTPKWLSTSISDDSVHGGFTGRVIMVTQNESRSFPWPKLREELFQDLLDDLIQISKINGEIKSDIEALEFFKDWYKSYSIELNKVEGNRVPFMQRLHDHLFKLATIISIAEDDDLVIKKSHLEKADLILKEILNKMEGAYIYIGTSRLGILREKMLQILCDKNGTITHSDMLSHFYRKYETSEVKESAKTLEEMGLIKIEYRNKKGSHKKSRFYIIQEHIMQDRKDSIIESLKKNTKNKKSNN